MYEKQANAGQLIFVYHLTTAGAGLNTFFYSKVFTIGILVLRFGFVFQMFFVVIFFVLHEGT